MTGRFATDITTEFPQQTIKPFIDESSHVVIGVLREDGMFLHPTNVEIIAGEEDDHAVRILTGGGGIAFTDPDATVEPVFHKDGDLFIRITTKHGTKEIKTPVDVHQVSGKEPHVSLEHRKGNTSIWSRLTEHGDTPEDE